MPFEVPEPVDVPTYGQSTSPLSTLARFVSLAWVPITASLVSLVLSVGNATVASIPLTVGPR
jgi:hypothetical protein